MEDSAVQFGTIFLGVIAFAAIVFIALVAPILYFAIRVLRRVESVAGKLDRGADELGKDIQEFRASVKEEGLKAKHIASFLRQRLVAAVGFGGEKKTRAKRRKAEEA